MVTCCENMQEILKFTIKCYMKAEDQVGKRLERISSAVWGVGQNPYWGEKKMQLVKHI